MNDHSYLHIALIYLAAINMATFFVYGIDKRKAKKSKWRIRETALLGLAVLGGSIGTWLGMKVWHHKTQHKKFKYGVPPGKAARTVPAAGIVRLCHVAASATIALSVAVPEAFTATPTPAATRMWLAGKIE